MATRKDVALIKRVLVKGLNHLKKSPQIAVRKSGVGDNLHVYILSDSFSRLSLTKRHEVASPVALDFPTSFVGVEKQRKFIIGLSGNRVPHVI